MTTLRKSDPLHFLDSAKERLHYIVGCFVVFAVEEESGGDDFGEGGEEGEVFEGAGDEEFRGAVPFELLDIGGGREGERRGTWSCRLSNQPGASPMNPRNL